MFYLGKLLAVFTNGNDGALLSLSKLDLLIAKLCFLCLDQLVSFDSYAFWLQWNFVQSSERNLKIMFLFVLTVAGRGSLNHLLYFFKILIFCSCNFRCGWKSYNTLNSRGYQPIEEKKCWDLNKAMSFATWFQ